MASGNFMFSFPDESKPYIPLMMPMFIENLQDNIPSVRSGAALALLSIVKTFGKIQWYLCLSLSVSVPFFNAG